MKVLVTGAGGFVGSHVVPAFRDRGGLVYPFDALDSWATSPPPMWSSPSPPPRTPERVCATRRRRTATASP